MSVVGVPVVNDRSSREAREFHQLKQRAAEYYRSNAVPQRMQQVLNTMFYEKPDDVYGHLANYFASFAKPAAISRIIGREILDINSQSTVEVEMISLGPQQLWVKDGNVTNIFIPDPNTALPSTWIVAIRGYYLHPHYLDNAFQIMPFGLGNWHQCGNQNLP